ncbi:MAG: hypothetical protein AAF485_21140 [Chloroflexota bacterium]
MTYLKGALTGVVVGAVVGSLLGSFVEFLLLSITWYIQGLIQGWPSEAFGQIIPWAILFMAVVTPASIFVGAIVGVIIGAFERIFHSKLNAGSFGGVVGSVVGLFVVPLLFGSDNEIGAIIITIVALSLTGVAVALTVKQVQKRFQ